MVVHGVDSRSTTDATTTGIVASRRRVVPSGGVPRAVGSSWKGENEKNLIKYTIENQKCEKYAKRGGIYGQREWLEVDFRQDGM